MRHLLALPAPVSGAIFLAASLVAALSSALMMARAFESQDPLRAGFAVMLAGLAIALAYEVWALETRLEPTISRITALAFVQHPVVWLVFYLGFMALAGALPFHFLFLNHRGHWAIIALGTAVMLGGAALTYFRGWTP